VIHVSGEGIQFLCDSPTLHRKARPGQLRLAGPTDSSYNVPADSLRCNSVTPRKDAALAALSLTCVGAVKSRILGTRVHLSRSTALLQDRRLSRSHKECPGTTLHTSSRSVLAQ
jgi:hypothetical protein